MCVALITLYTLMLFYVVLLLLLTPLLLLLYSTNSQQLERMPLHTPERKRTPARPPSIQVCRRCLPLPQGRRMHDGRDLSLLPRRL